MNQRKRVCGLLNISLRCNQDCLFCCDGDLKGTDYHLTSKEARQRISEIAQQGADSITIIGGEPLVRRNLAEFVAYARDLGLRVGLTTNGRLLTRARLSDLIAAGLTSVEISIHSFDPALADVIAQRPKTAARQREALENVARRPGLGVSVNFVVFSKNFRELPSFAATLVREHSYVDEFFVNFLDPIGYSAHDHSLLPTYTEVAPHLTEALDAARDGGMSYTVDSVPGCVLGPHFLFLRATREKLRGVVYAKKTLRIEDSSPEPDLSQYYRVNACFDCPVSGLCPGVNFRYLAMRGAGEFRPFPVALLDRGGYHLPAEAPATLSSDLSASLKRWREGLEVVEVPVEDRCNNRCGWCPGRETAGRTDSSPAAMTRRLTRELESSHGRTILFTGGEPTLNRALFKLVSQVARTGRRAGFTTNGRVFAYEQWARRAAASQASLVRLCLPAPIGAIEARAGVEGAEEQALAGLDNLLAQRKFFVEAEVGVPAGTQGLVEKTLAYLADRGVYRVSTMEED
jgi:MoaA/NifB/PqqE/SkfB family radical SAM enzyme